MFISLYSIHATLNAQNNPTHSGYVNCALHQTVVSENYATLVC